jgi:hypothetical protein
VKSKPPHKECIKSPYRPHRCLFQRRRTFAAFHQTPEAHKFINILGKTITFLIVA